jgi:hypothetical protein
MMCSVVVMVLEDHRWMNLCYMACMLSNDVVQHTVLASLPPCHRFSHLYPFPSSTPCPTHYQTNNADPMQIISFKSVYRKKLLATRHRREKGGVEAVE